MIIDADCFLAILLSHTETLTIREATKLRSEIEAENMDVVVDLSGQAIRRATGYYPTLFQFQDKQIRRAPGFPASARSEFVIEEFSREVPRSLLERLDQHAARALTEAR
ncbi:MAG: hypothetical protein NTW87_06425 [Planctomycetota bacterium]|nr:hypothetical protein [Planctomycetota bacterium]